MSAQLDVYRDRLREGGGPALVEALRAFVGDLPNDAGAHVRLRAYGNLGSALIQASEFDAGLICFDNLAGGFGGSSLDRCLTAIDTVELRILGKSEIHELKWRAIITATGNNPELFGDTPRRVLQSTLEPKEENPEERDAGRYRHHPLLPWVLSERARLERLLQR